VAGTTIVFDNIVYIIGVCNRGIRNTIGYKIGGANRHISFFGAGAKCQQNAKHKAVAIAQADYTFHSNFF
jgi:hypothetical protein